MTKSKGPPKDPNRTVERVQWALHMARMNLEEAEGIIECAREDKEDKRIIKQVEDAYERFFDSI